MEIRYNSKIINGSVLRAWTVSISTA